MENGIFRNRKTFSKKLILQKLQNAFDRGDTKVARPSELQSGIHLYTVIYT